MIQRVGEAIVLRTWPFHEADLLVSLFTREQGKVKGVARHAMQSRRRFGGALEPMTHVRATYAERPRQELVRLDAFEILSSPMSRPVDYARTAALQMVAEVLEEAMPEGAPEDAVFRLAVAVTGGAAGGAGVDADDVFCAVDESADGMDAGAGAGVRSVGWCWRRDGVVFGGGRWGDVRGVTGGRGVGGCRRRRWVWRGGCFAGR